MEQKLKTTPPNAGTQTCKCCGRELPLGNFARGGFGLRKTCNECIGKNTSEAKRRKKEDKMEALRRELAQARALRLRDFQPRELMIELRERGYEGTLVYTQRHEIDIAKVD